MIVSLGFVAVYVVLVGIAAFAEKVVSRSLDAFELNLVVRAGILLLALPAVVVAHGFALPGLLSLLAGLGIGALSGVGVLFYFLALRRLPVWLVVSLADGYILVTACLGFLVLGEAVTVPRICGASHRNRTSRVREELCPPEQFPCGGAAPGAGAGSAAPRRSWVIDTGSYT